MRNWESLKSQYLGFDRPQQLGNLAASLRRISTHLQFGDAVGSQVAVSAMEECQHFTEWLVMTLNLEDEGAFTLAVELIEVGRQVSQWKYQWQGEGFNLENRRAIVDSTVAWSDRLLVTSGLLARETV